MPAPVAIQALSQAAQKRRLLGRAPAQRLADLAANRGITDCQGLRAWLETGDGLSPDLARRLSTLLPPAGGRFGPYEAQAHLADGGMGSVWMAARAGDPAAPLVVVKTIKAGVGEVAKGTGSQATEFVRRFEREVRVTRQLDHPNVVRCIDHGVADETTLYMVLEYVDSGDLRDLVEMKGGLSEGLAVAIMHQVAEGLCEAHRLKLVHRDIKPPNIFVASSGLAKLADFGIARSTESTRTMLTMQGAIVGSPQYMSPEQVMTDPTLDIRSDIYAMGCVLYYCLAGEPPYGGKLQEILHKHCTAPIPDIRQKRPSVSAQTAQVIATAMAKDRGKRYADPTALRDALAGALHGLGISPPKDDDTRDVVVAGRREGSSTRLHSTSISTLTADLRKAAGLDEDIQARMAEQAPTQATRADAAAATITADLSASSPAAPPPGADQLTLAADLSGGQPAGSDQPTIASDLSGSPPPGTDLPTMAMDLSGARAGADKTVPMATPPPAPAAGGTPDLPTMAMDLSAPMASMTAILMANELAAPLKGGSGSPPPVPQRVTGTGTVQTPAEMGTIARIMAGQDVPAKPASAESLVGDATQALACPWLTLVPDGGGEALVMLFAKTSVVMGKLREPPVDLCVRNYPIATYKDSLQRISRQHLVLRYDAIADKAILEDMNAPNGTVVDGIGLPSGGRAELTPGSDAIVSLANAATLWFRPLPARTTRTSIAGLGAPGGCGIDTDNGLDAVVISRPENRPEMAYAAVLRRLTVGGPGADLALAGARTRAAAEIARAGDRWIWRPATEAGPWRPMVPGDALDLGGRIFRPVPGAHPQFG
jgi:serine/threonine protein kinase